jgi:SNF2 family DNA or RNA helicase
MEDSFTLKQLADSEMYLDKSRGVFVQSRESSHPILANELDSREAEILEEFPDYIFVPSFSDVTFKYYFVNQEIDLLGVQVKIGRNGKGFEISPPSFLEADYIIHDKKILPLRHEDFIALNSFLPTLERDGLTGMNIEELMNFEHFCSVNGFEVDNPELKDKVLSSKKVDVGRYINDLSIEPYPYQVIGIEWLTSQKKLGLKGAILADVMGLGKTLQVIGFIAKNVKAGLQNNLVICPATLIDNWKSEFIKFAPNLNFYTHFGPFRTGVPSGLVNHDVVITSYDALIADHSILRTIDWNIVALDEAQQIKNPDTKRTIRSKDLKRSFGVAITGTPLENRLRDVWSLSDFAQPGLFGSEDSFIDEFESDPGGAREVNRVLRSVMLRRKLSDINHQLPEKIVINHPLRWPEELNELYETTRRDALEEFSTAGGLVATGRLRKLTTHPILMDVGPASDLLALSPKFALTVDILEELFANNEKCLIFASYREIMDRFENDIRHRFPQAMVEILDGRTEISNRQPLVERFNAFQGPGVLICNPIVAGAGLNITGANHVIHYNLEWNPAKEDQATFRVYRNGQLKETFIHRLFYIDTIDQVIDERIESKRGLADLSLDNLISRDDYLAALQVSPSGANNAY